MSAPTPTDSQSTGAPRHAATVVIARPGPAGLEVYMTLRSAASPFMPSTLVFPGGRLDAADGPPDDDHSWERAARRECLEEAGIDLTERRLLWFDTWLTPSAESARRYLARFYFVCLAPGEGEQARADGHETHAGRWSSVQAHLEAWHAGEVDLPPPTLCTLLRIQGLDRGRAEALLSAASPKGVILPKAVLAEGKPCVVLPHDPQYDQLSGEALPAPPRVHALPMRFVRDERRWKPCETPR